MQSQKLTDDQRTIVLRWLAQDIAYPELHQKMVDTFGITISSPACTYYRRKYKQEISTIRLTLERINTRLKNDRLRKEIERYGDKRKHHCPTCQCGLVVQKDVKQQAKKEKAQVVLHDVDKRNDTPLAMSISIALQDGPVYIQDLCRQLGVPIESINTALLFMEMQGQVRNIGSMTYIKLKQS